METVKYFQSATDEEGESNPTGDGFLRSISVDRSCIAPGLLLWFFFYIAICSGRSLWMTVYQTKDDSLMEVPGIPLPTSYAITWVQLGFIGTLWGFMLIGIKMGDTNISKAGESVLDILLKAFETALLSTFVAVVLVYVFSPLVIRLWRWIHDMNTLEPEIVGGDIEKQLDALSKGLKKTTLSVTKLNTEIGELKNTISNFSPEEIVKILREIAVDIKTVSGLGDLIRGTRDTVMQATPTIMQRIEQAESSIVNKTESGVNILSKNLGVDIIPENGENMRSEIRAGQNKTNKELSTLKERIDPMEGNITKEIRVSQDKTNKVLSKVNMQKISLMKKEDGTASPEQYPNFREKKTTVDRLLKFFRIK
jgi:hypothetical protein